MISFCIGDTVTKVTSTNLNKKQPAAVNSEAKRTPTADGDAGSDQEDDGQWVTQGSKQVCSYKIFQKYKNPYLSRLTIVIEIKAKQKHQLQIIKHPHLHYQIVILYQKNDQ